MDFLDPSLVPFGLAWVIETIISERLAPWTTPQIFPSSKAMESPSLTESNRRPELFQKKKK